MTESTRAEWIALLRRQLHEAEEREIRWQVLGEHLRKTHEGYWTRIADLRRLEVEQFRLLIDHNEHLGRS